MKSKGGSVDLSGWILESADDVARKIADEISGITLKAAGEAVQYALEDPETRAYFPAEWGDTDGIDGPPVEDPLTVYVRIALHTEGEPPTWEFNIREILQDTIDDCASDGFFSEGLGRISSALRDLADDIDNARNEYVSRGIK